MLIMRKSFKTGLIKFKSHLLVSPLISIEINDISCLFEKGFISILFEKNIILI